MFKAFVFAIIFVCIAVAAAVGQSVYTPEKGSAVRAGILNALRAPVKRDLRQKIVFVIDNFKVQGNWAFVSGNPQSPAGGEPSYRNTKYWTAVDSGAFDNNFFALLKKTGSRWKVITFAIGCTDVCYSDWWSRYRSPKAIFPYTE